VPVDGLDDDCRPMANEAGDLFDSTDVGDEVLSMTQPLTGQADATAVLLDGILTER
jgi:hypothetical protein